MALTYSEKGELGSIAPDFHLLGTNGVHHGLRDFRNARVLVLVFMCNHCPYVKAVRERINRLATEGSEHGVVVVGINSNDSTDYPDDSFEAMKREAAQRGYQFHYLWDETQEVAKAYGAVCTPDFYVYKNETEHKDPVRFTLKYRGRLDDNWQNESEVRTRDLRLAIDAVLEGREPRADQVPSMGCSIKWRGERGTSLRGLALSVLLAGLLAAAAPAPARADTVSDGQVWYQFLLQPKLTQHIKAYFELQARYAQDLTRLDRLLIRPAVNYGWDNGLSAWVGYVSQPVFVPVRVPEDRWWQQLQHDWKQGDAWWVQNRLRVEERWTPAVSGSVRLRYMLRGLRQVGSGGVYGVGSAELFETLANPLPGAQGGFDQARLFGGIHFKLNSEVRAETGYMYNPVNRRGAGPDRANHNWVLTFFWNPDLTGGSAPSAGPAELPSTPGH